ncbi:MAG: hypothetical protein QOE22_754 [Candidatus Parcubacteria bacterium]|jgi:rRNA maturation endonuclease Nob1|nr:hypothetical protein [Candidatus Parcubacteria bacterium]
MSFESVLESLLPFLFIAVALVSLFTRQVGSLRKHKHKCPNCSCVWEHTSKEGQDENAHNCPQCGTEERWVYFGG